MAPLHAAGPASLGHALVDAALGVVLGVVLVGVVLYLLRRRADDRRPGNGI